MIYDPISYTFKGDKCRETREPTKKDQERGEFEIDRSRILHSAAFRRLQGKTQVFGVHEGDFFRTRLTHTLEVAQVGKGLALRLGAHPDLVEAAALAHDIGHPPFGHAGEHELHALMKDYGGFEANGQNLRILTHLERKSRDYLGLNLTRATLDAQFKYKREFTPGLKKNFYYETEKDRAVWINENCYPNADCQSFECQIVEWADDVAYAVHDLEDSIHAGLISQATFANERLCRKIVDTAYNALSKKHDARLSKNEIKEAWADLKQFMRKKGLKTVFNQGDSVEIRRCELKQLTSALINRYICAADRGEIPEGPSCNSERYKYRVEINKKPEMKWEVELLKQLLCCGVFQSPRLVHMEEKGCHIISQLFKKFMGSQELERILPEEWQEGYLNGMSEKERARLICDFISSMTDNSAQRIYSKLFLPHQGSAFDVA